MADGMKILVIMLAINIGVAAIGIAIVFAIVRLIRRSMPKPEDGLPKHQQRLVNTWRTRNAIARFMGGTWILMGGLGVLCTVAALIRRYFGWEPPPDHVAADPAVAVIILAFLLLIMFFGVLMLRAKPWFPRSVRDHIEPQERHQALDGTA
jgi:hypothetical protein